MAYTPTGTLIPTKIHGLIMEKYSKSYKFSIVKPTTYPGEDEVNGVIWITDLEAAGKSEDSEEVQKAKWAAGRDYSDPNNPVDFPLVGNFYIVANLYSFPLKNPKNQASLDGNYSIKERDGIKYLEFTTTKMVRIQFKELNANSTVDDLINLAIDYLRNDYINVIYGRFGDTVFLDASKKYEAKEITNEKLTEVYNSLGNLPENKVAFKVEDGGTPVSPTETISTTDNVVATKVESPTAVAEVQFKFNVEKTDTFIVVGGTVSPPLELVIVPNDGNEYILEIPDVFNNDGDLGEEYQETEFIGLQEKDMVFEIAESMTVGTEGDYPTPPLDPNSPPGPDSGKNGPNTYNNDGISAADWEKKGTVVIGSKVPSNLSGPAVYNKKVTLNNTMTTEYVPIIKGMSGYSNGIKLLAMVMAQKEGFKSGTRSYRTNNPGNIGNTDSGSNKSLKTLEDGIRLQLDYITKVAKGQHTAYPLGKEKNMKPYYSPEIAKNNGPNGPYKGSTAFLPGYKFTYTGMIEQYCKIYATGSRQNNSYISMIVSWFRQNGYNWVTEETTIAQLIEQNLPIA